jgi:hypothetical protein
MSPVNETEMEPQPAGMSEIGRLTGVFFEPKKAFADIAQRPRWFIPLLLVILTAMAYITAVGQHIGWATIIRHQFETNKQMQQMPAEQREQAMNIGLKIAPISGYVGVAVFVPVFYVLMAGLLTLVAGGIMSAGVKFKQVFAIVCYSGMPGILFSLLAIVVVFLKNPDDFNMENPLAFNPGAFMDPSAGSKFVYSFASSFDLFQIWSLLLMATGLKVAAGKKLSFGGALFAVFLPWLVLIFIKSALAGLRG